MTEEEFDESYDKYLHDLFESYSGYGSAEDDDFDYDVRGVYTYDY